MAAWTIALLMAKRLLMQFKLGDVVCLKSGGPTMTVADLTDDGYIATAWFGGSSEEPRVFQFAPELLKLVTDEELKHVRF